MELQDPTKTPPVTPSDEEMHSIVTVRNNGRDVLTLQPDDDPTTFILRNKGATFDKQYPMRTIDEMGPNESSTDPPGIDERVEADFASFDEHFGQYDHDTFELSINDKMKNVLKELKQDERVRLSWSRSMEESSKDDTDNGNDDTYGDVDDSDAFKSYEERTGSNGTVFMVRERLINDFYSHNDSDSVDPNLPSLDRNENFDTILEETDDERLVAVAAEEEVLQSEEFDSNAHIIDNCKVFENPNAEHFLEIERVQSARERLTLDLNKCTDIDNNFSTTAKETVATPDTDDVSSPLTPTSSSSTGNNNRKKKRKNKNKRK